MPLPLHLIYIMSGKYPTASHIKMMNVCIKSRQLKLFQFSPKAMTFFLRLREAEVRQQAMQTRERQKDRNVMLMPSWETNKTDEDAKYSHSRATALR